MSFNQISSGKPSQRGRPHGIAPRGEKAKDAKGNLKKLMKYIGKFKWIILAAFLLSIASTVFSILGPKILGSATTELFKGIMSMISGIGSGINYKHIAQILIFLLILYAISMIFSAVQGIIMTDVSTKISYQLYRDMQAKIHRLPVSYFDHTTTGEILSRFSNDVSLLTQSLTQGLSQMINSITMIIGIMVMMFSISWQMTLISLLVLPVSFLFISKLIKHSQKYFAQQQEYLGHVNSHVEEMYGNHLLVKAFNMENSSKQKFEKYNNVLYHAAWKSNFLSGLMMPVMNFIINIGYVVICIMGGHYAVTGVISVGDIQAFIQYVRQFMQPISQIANISNVFQQMAASAERVFEFLDEPEETPDSADALTVFKDKARSTDVNIKGSITFDHVHFGYSQDKIIINDFSAKVLPGQKIAIVGPTGAGKTTIVKLLMRFYDVTGGSILVDNYNIREFNRNDLRSLFGMVLQETWLYSATISDNIRYGCLSATDKEVFDAAEAAQVNHFVHTLPGGYNMVLNEEASNISQGQKQLLTIARAILANPKILILDEATSSVDTRTEILIQKAMDNLMHGRTSFIIAHRLSTIKNADLILVMNHGDIVEQGTHEQLLQRNGFYAELYNSQFETEA